VAGAPHYDHPARQPENHSRSSQLVSCDPALPKWEDIVEKLSPLLAEHGLITVQTCAPGIVIDLEVEVIIKKQAAVALSQASACLMIGSATSSWQAGLPRSHKRRDRDLASHPKTRT
jgi:hypothetical protein